jgi:hypothetical protein
MERNEILRSPFTKMNFLRRIFPKPEPTKAIREIPPMPEGWNLTLTDLMEEIYEGKRKSVGSPEADWAREYERSKMPDTYRFPEKGDLYECIEDHEVTFMTSWAAPFTGDGKSTLLKGDKVWVDSAPNDPKPIGTYAQAVDYESLEKRMVREKERTAANYTGFYFYFDTVTLNGKFRLIETDYNGKGEDPTSRHS